MNNSDWIWWFFYADPFWTAPVRLVVIALAGLGFVIIGIPSKKWKYVLWGTAVIILEVVDWRYYQPDLLDGFAHFHLLAVKVFYGALISVIAILIMIAFKIMKSSE
jgi:hypothetical protein